MKRNERILFSAAAFLLLMAIILLATARWLLDPADNNWQWTWWDGAFRVFFLIAIVGVISVLIRVPQARSRGFMGLVVLALVGLDLVTAGLRVNPVVVTKAFGPLELNMSSRPKYGESRAMLSRQASLYLSFATTGDPLYHYAGLRGALFENCNIPENIPKVDGFCSLHLKDEWDIDGILYGAHSNKVGTNVPPAPLLDFLGVSRISAPDTIFAWQERRSSLPLVTAGQQPIFAGELDTLRKLGSTDFNPRHTVYLPLSAQSEVTVTNASEAKIISQQFAAQRIQLTVEAPSPALVVIAQAFYHNWHAFVDGTPVPILRANHAFQALEVPAGQHKITLRYEDGAFHIGAVVSALTLLGCLTGLFMKPRH